MNIEQVAVNIHIPINEACIVAMQPFIRFQTPIQEPFRWSIDKVNDQLNAITRTLDLAQNGFGGRVANFTLFPEYSIPGLAGATIIDERISDEAWANESIIIAGIHGLDKVEYSALCQQLETTVSPANSPDSVRDDQWVNCCITWIKDQNGRVHKWVQPKIKPAWLEVSASCQDMFCGSTVYVFKARYSNDFPCNFFTLICYDWVAADACPGSTVCNEVLNQLNRKWRRRPAALDLVFVIQHNPGTNHTSFLNSTYHFLTNSIDYPFVQRKEAVVLHANTAVSIQPARGGFGAFTSCVFSPSVQLDFSSCRPTICMQPNILRGSDILLRCKDVVFREMGECTHLFKVRIPRFVVPDATDRTPPLHDAKVYALTEVDDPRLSGAAVPAALKWINDSLDCVESLAINAFEGCSLNAEAESVQPMVISKIRILDGQTAANHINWAACSLSHGVESRSVKHQQNADVWGQSEMDALEHLIHSLTSLGLIYNLEITNSLLHGSLNSDTACVQIVAIRGETYTDCRRHYDEAIPNSGVDPVLVITRDRANLKPTLKEYSKFYEADKEQGLAFLDYQSLVTFCREAEDKETLRRNLDDFIPGERRII